MILVTLCVVLQACISSTPQLNYQQLVHAAVQLEMDIAFEDNHKLYIESSEWIGTPYKYGGNSRYGVDCSGLTTAIYKKGSSEKWSDIMRINKKKTAEEFVFLNNHKQIYKYEQQFSISCVGSL